MRESVKKPFLDYSINHEGFTTFMYCDVLNLVTTGIGNLIDMGPNHNLPGATTAQRAQMNTEISAAAMAPAMGLPWKKRGAGWTTKNPVTSGGIVGPAEIADAWARVKADNATSGRSQQGGFKYAGLTDITLDMDGLEALVTKTRNSFDASLAKRYPGYDTYPADAQFALMSMSWAMGPGFADKRADGTRGFPAFYDAMAVRDFAKAAGLCSFKGGEQSGRNKDNALMFNNAAAVERGDGDASLLYFPGSPAKGKQPSSSAGSPYVASVGTGGIVPPDGAVETAVKVAGGAAVLGAGWGLYKWWKGRG